MPLHDWKRVSAGTFHILHSDWTIGLYHALNAGILPNGFYATVEQRALGGIVPDLLALESRPESNSYHGPVEGGGVATLLAPPRLEVAADFEAEEARTTRVVAVRRTPGDRLAAVIEIVSSGNKESAHAVRSFTRKVAELFTRGVHFLMLDVHPHGPRDPAELHNLVLSEWMDTAPPLPADRPLTFASFDVGERVRAYVVTANVGDPLPTMPLFLLPGLCVEVPLEPTYQAAFTALPAPLRGPLEA